mmetsp:Transcript_24210/g.22013  ORF Transcript_24210/g.22013 Transcript_24210/m.22013 type:complete len:206 (+) Transcript_24210:8-625(+)
MSSFEKSIKLLLLGDSCVGKTSLIDRYCNDTYSINTKSHIGLNYTIKNINLNDENTITNIRLTAYNLTGGRRLLKFTPGYFKISHGIMLIYDVTDRDSYESLKLYYDAVTNTKNSKVNATIIIVGNKCDNDIKREVSYEEGESFANQYNLKFYETSAKDNINIDQVFSFLINNEYNRLCDEEYNEVNEILKGCQINDYENSCIIS